MVTIKTSHIIFKICLESGKLVGSDLITFFLTFPSFVWDKMCKVRVPFVRVTYFRRALHDLFGQATFSRETSYTSVSQSVSGARSVNTYEGLRESSKMAETFSKDTQDFFLLFDNFKLQNYLKRKILRLSFDTIQKSQPEMQNSRKTEPKLASGKLNTR